MNVHDSEDKKLGKVVPYGVYDMTANAGFVSVGITSDTAEFAVQSIRCWLERMGRKRYRMRANSGSPPTAAARMAGGCGSATSNCKSWRRDRPRDPRPPLSARHIGSGTRSSTGGVLEAMPVPPFSRPCPSVEQWRWDHGWHRWLPRSWRRRLDGWCCSRSRFLGQLMRFLVLDIQGHERTFIRPHRVSLAFSR